MPCFPCFKRSGKEKYTLGENKESTPSKTPPQQSQVKQPAERTPSPEKTTPPGENNPQSTPVVKESVQKSERVQVEASPRELFFSTQPSEPVPFPKREPVQLPKREPDQESKKEPVQVPPKDPVQVPQKESAQVSKKDPSPEKVVFVTSDNPDDLDSQAAFELALSTLAKLYEIRPEDLTPEMSQEMERLVSRLEKVADRLEATAAGGAGGASAGGDALPVFVDEFDAQIINGGLATFLQGSKKIGGSVAEVAPMVERGYKAVRDLLVTASKQQKPKDADLQKFLKPLVDIITEVQNFREKNRRDAHFNHLSAVSEGIPALGWVSVAPTPGPYVQQMEESSQFYTNKVLKEFRESDPKQADWAKNWIKMLKDLAAYIKEFHRTGLTWNPKGVVSAAPAPPPPGAPAPPPPPPVLPPTDGPAPASKGSAGDAAKAALFSELNKGTDVTKGLKKVTDDMKTHKNPGLRLGPAPYQKPVTAPKPGSPRAAPKPAASKPPKLALEGKKWLVEHQDNQSNLMITTGEIQQTVYVYKCTNSTLKITTKINSITLDNCKKMALVFEDVVSCVDFVNCQRIQAQVLGKCSLFNIDKTDGCQVFLSKDSINAEIVTAKSSEMNIMVPKDDGDFDEFPLPEQFKSKYDGKKGFKTDCTESV
ncbi:adenylyl cyclase-associated protein 1-like [Lineus longissimus]|uniref:adenylyl cyclase-associated protein 1-like n=1 Tax=Lineus longissimus TaxID=88925 RepID=UPI00315D2F54